MKTITICGSMKFQDEMQKIAFLLETKHGYNVLQCVYFYSDRKLTDRELEFLEKAHYKKIDLSDAIYVVDIEGYIGSSTRKEINYANERNIEVILHSKFTL